MSDYQRRADALKDLPRAERFEHLLTFPTEFTFKAIGKDHGFVERIKALLAMLGHPDVVLVERASARGKYTSVSITLNVQSGSEIDKVYSGLEQLDGIAYLI
jgi:putative lipoic acid-binding regulatory protein